MSKYVALQLLSTDVLNVPVISHNLLLYQQHIQSFRNGDLALG
jgi:hypothetical protein